MTLLFEDQYRLAVVEPSFAAQVSAATFTAAIGAFALPPLPDPAQQAQRMSLVHLLIQDVTKFGAVFRWLCVSRPTLETVDDLTDDTILSTVAGFLDPVAQQLMLP